MRVPEGWDSQISRQSAHEGGKVVSPTHRPLPPWNIPGTHFCWGTRWRSWLRHCATSRKVAGLIPDGVTGIFHWHNLSGRTMALGLTQHLTEINTRNISWGKRGRCIGQTTLPTSWADCLENGSLNLLEHSGSVQACNGIALPLLFTHFC